MTHRRRRLRMAALIATLVAIAVVFVCSGTVLFAQRNREGFAFVEQEGDVSVLEEIQVTGVLEDTFQRVAFASQGQRLTQRILPQALMRKTQEEATILSYFSEALPGVEIDRQFYKAGETIELADGSFSQSENPTVGETADQFALYLTNDGYIENSLRIQTEVTYHRRITILYFASEDGRKVSLMSQADFVPPWDAVQLNGRCYTATLTDENCRGTGGIYDLTAVPGSSSGGPETVQKANLFPIDLQDGKVEIVSLEACGEELALFCRQEGALTVRLIDPRTWQTTKTIALPGWENYTFYTVKGNTMLLAATHAGGEEAEAL